MDYEWKRESGDGRWRIPCSPRFARGIGTILGREIGTSTGRGFATSERGHLCDADLVVPAVAAAAAGKGYLGAKAQSKATLVGAALAFFVIGASVSPLFRALMINTHCGQFSVSVVVETRW